MFDVKALQRRLGVAVDGDAGPLTYARLFQQMGAPVVTAATLGLSAAVYLPRYEIDGTPMRLIHFLGQTAHESARYRLLREVWGPTPAQLRYEGRADLGNTEPGDGRRYLGRAPLQVTGRANYRRASRKMGVDVEAQPELLERPDFGLWASCIWWSDNGANRWADTGSVAAVSRLVNRGDARSDKPANHEAERAIETARARALVLGDVA